MRPRNPALTAALRESLHQESFARWPDGWSLAQRLGPPALPALRAALRAESNRLQRWTMLGACVVAGADAEGDAWLVEVAANRGRPQEERALALLCLAAMPARTRDEPVLGNLVGAERAGSYVQLAAALAAVRFEDDRAFAAPVRGGPLTSEAIVAALGGTQAREVLERACAGLGDARPALAGQVVRAWCLGRAQSTRDAIELALGLAARTELTDPVRVAATIFAVAGSPEQAVARLGGDPGLRATLASSSAARRTLFASGRLGPVPELVALPRVRTALAVAYGLSVPWVRAMAESAEWGREAPIADAVCFALAWRSAAEPAAPAPPPEILARGTEATTWLALAAGLPASLPAGAPTDPRAARVLELVRLGRLDSAALAVEIEDVMWRRGLHPGLVVAQAWTDLVRDALLAGSQYVSGRLQLPLDARPPLPRDIEDSHEKFFRCADSLFRFLTERAPSPPPSLRLR